MESSEDDAVLVARARAGDRSAFGGLAERHGARVQRFLTTMIGDDSAAADLRQEALRLALERLQQLDDPARFWPWLLSIAINRCRNHLQQEVRRRAAGGEALERVPDQGRRSALSSLVRRESAELVALAIERLPILLREAFVLFHVEQLAYAEMTGVTGASVGTLQVRVHRARGLLRQQLGEVVDTWWQRGS